MYSEVNTHLTIDATGISRPPPMVLRRPSASSNRACHRRRPTAVRPALRLSVNGAPGWLARSPWQDKAELRPLHAGGCGSVRLMVGMTNALISSPHEGHAVAPHQPNRFGSLHVADKPTRFAQEHRRTRHRCGNQWTHQAKMGQRSNKLFSNRVKRPVSGCGSRLRLKRLADSYF